MNNLRYAPLINGVEHSWASIVVQIDNIISTGVRAISYSDEQEMENVYGAGAYPVARTYGRIQPTASITILRSEIEVIRGASPTRRLQDIAPFTITVSYVPINGQKVATHVLRNCQFKNDSAEWKEGDMYNEEQLELLISNIERK